MRRQEHVTVAEQGRFLWGQPTIRELAYVGIHLVQQSLEPGNVFRASSMNSTPAPESRRRLQRLRLASQAESAVAGSVHLIRQLDTLAECAD